MALLYINKQTEAEKDSYLFDCFHDTGILNELVNSSSTIIAGRKGSGKTALARYLEKNTSKYKVDFAYRISVRNFNTLGSSDQKTKLNSILFYIAVKSIQKMLNINFFDSDSLAYWKDFLLQNGLQQTSDYESFVVTQKTRGSNFSIKAVASYLFASIDSQIKSNTQSTSDRIKISESPSSIYESLRQTVSPKKSIIIFIDDISDYLDESDTQNLKDDINIIKDLLLGLQTINLLFLESELNVRFVSLIREDLYEFMEGSNINKLKSDSLFLEWNQKDFANLLIKRMPYFENNLDFYLKDPVKSLKERFPDEIFSTFLKKFSTKRYGCNFYAYMAAISFNRPRDFLQFCYALRNRLSSKGPATFENIESAEIEYSNYFIQELRDELYIASRVFQYDLTQERIDNLIDILSQREGFNTSQLKTDLSHFINVKTSIGWKKIEMLISELWRYGVIGVSDDSDSIIRFKYLYDSAVFTSQSIKKYVFFLHRGLWWFSRKRKGITD